MRPRCIALATLFVAGVGRADVWDIQAIVGNDAFDGVLSHHDDNGFTNDLRFAIRDRHGELALGASISDRMITSSEIMRRCDLVELFATGAWVLDDVLGIELRARPTIAGDLGGLWVQSHWHRLTHTGPRDPAELPTEYEQTFRIAGVAGMRAESGYGGPIRAYGALDGQVALGETGVTFAEGTAGVRAAYRIGPVEVGAFGELALGRYRVDDPELAMPGAYRPGWQTDRRIGLRIGVNRYRVSFAYHTNETSSGEAFSEITFERR